MAVDLVRIRGWANATFVETSWRKRMCNNTCNTCSSTIGRRSPTHHLKTTVTTGVWWQSGVFGKNFASITEF